MHRDPGSPRHAQPAISRRDAVSIGIGVFVVAAVPLAARRGPAVTRRTLPVMGTIAEVVVVGPRPAAAQAAIDAAMHELVAVERAMSRFRADSDIGRANAGAARGPVPVHAHTATVVQEALAWAARTGGAFDPAIGRVVEQWDVAHRTTPPDAAQLRALAGGGLWRGVEVGTERGIPVLHYASPAIHLDLGGIAKGWAVDRAADVLRAHGVTRALVNVGGDLVASGTGPHDGPWQIGVRDPDDARFLATTLDASDCAIATSGDYEQFFRWRGQRYHHLMDPVTAAPARGAWRSVTVQAARCVDADAGATAAFTSPNRFLQATLAERAARLVHSA